MNQPLAIHEPAARAIRPAPVSDLRSPADPVGPAARCRLPGPGSPLVDLGLATFGWGWHMEAGLCALRLILRGTFDRHPDLQLVLGHWGEKARLLWSEGPGSGVCPVLRFPGPAVPGSGPGGGTRRIREPARPAHHTPRDPGTPPHQGSTAM